MQCSRRIVPLLVILAVAACAHSSIGAAAPPPSEEPYEFVARSGEHVAAMRGSFQVPENRADPGSRRITLHYLRFPSTAANPGPPLVYLAGGPGGSALAAAQGARFPLFMALREVGDVIAFEQRGVGWSNQIPRCTNDYLPPLDRPLDRDATIAAFQREAAACVRFWREQGVDVRGYNTLESARDLEDLRRHLGVDRISLWGISYGTHLALAALKVMDDRLDRVVLASPDGLDQNIKMPAEGDALFERMQAVIDADPEACALYPDAAGLIRRVLARLEAEPAHVRVDDNGNAVEFVMGGWEVRLLTAVSLADPPNIAGALSLYRAADAGDYDPLARQVYALLRRSPYQFSGMRELMDASSGMPAADIPIVEEQARTALLGDLINFPVMQLRDAFGPLDLGDGFREPPRSRRPVLVLSGTLDGRTFPNDHRAAVRGLSSVTFVIVENGGHNLYEADPRIQALVVAFLRGDPVADQTITLPPPHFQ